MKIRLTWRYMLNVYSPLHSDQRVSSNARVPLYQLKSKDEELWPRAFCELGGLAIEFCYRDASKAGVWPQSEVIS